jgi:hypothetical protein
MVCCRCSHNEDDDATQWVLCFEALMSLELSVLISFGI